MADTTTEQVRTSRGAEPGGGGRSAKQLLFVAVGAAVAIALVVVLALVGLAHHKQPVQAQPTTTLGNPNLSNGAAKPHTVTYSNTMVTLPYQGMDRTYLLSRPATTSQVKLPVIVVLHGRGVTPAYEYQRTDFTSVISPAILVYPAGYQGSWDAGNCCAAAQAAHLDDTGFVQAVIAQVKVTQRDASPGKVYLVGYSNGGKLALDLACQDPDGFEAVAVYGATDASTCTTRPSVNLLEVGGSIDPAVPASDAEPVPEADGFKPPTFLGEIAAYRQADGCSDQGVVTTVGTVTLTSWVRCAGGARVGEAIFSGQGHMWPAGSGTTPSAEGVMWAWFKALGAAA
jgi:polyhydroxybutyrate depolymerase